MSVWNWSLGFRRCSVFLNECDHFRLEKQRKFFVGFWFALSAVIDWLINWVRSTTAQSWTAPVSVLGCSWPTFSLLLQKRDFEIELFEYQDQTDVWPLPALQNTSALDYWKKPFKTDIFDLKTRYEIFSLFNFDIFLEQKFLFLRAWLCRPNGHL